MWQYTFLSNLVNINNWEPKNWLGDVKCSSPETFMNHLGISLSQYSWGLFLYLPWSVSSPLTIVFAELIIVICNVCLFRRETSNQQKMNKIMRFCCSFCSGSSNHSGLILCCFSLYINIAESLPH